MTVNFIPQTKALIVHVAIRALVWGMKLTVIGYLHRLNNQHVQ
jgi:hypothetical protein